MSEICEMNDYEITEFINQNLEIINKHLRKNIAILIEKYLIENEKYENDENEADEEDEEEDKKQIIINKKDGKTKIIINI